MAPLNSLAALYDVHGNLPALDAVLAELRADPPDAVVVGGDVAAGPQPKEVLRGYGSWRGRCTGCAGMPTGRWSWASTARSRPS